MRPFRADGILLIPGVNPRAESLDPCGTRSAHAVRRRTNAEAHATPYRHRLLAIGYWLLVMRSALPGSIMQTHRAIHVCVPFRGIEEKLDAAAGLLPLITDHGFHHVALRLLIPG